MAITQTIYLTQGEWKVPPTLHMVQGDTGRSLKMIVMDTVMAGTEAGNLVFEREDGTRYAAVAVYESADSSFTADVTQALTCPGRTTCQLKVTDSNDEVVSTYSFIIDVQENPDGTTEEQLGYSIEQIQAIIEGAVAAMEIVGTYSDGNLTISLAAASSE